MEKYIMGEKYIIEVDGEYRECIYCGREFGKCVFEIVGTTLLVYKEQ